MYYLIFDFDGVFWDSWDATVQAYMLNHNETDRQKVENYLLNERLVKPRYTKERVYTAEETEELMKYREMEYHAKAKFNPKFFDGFIKELSKIKDAKMAIVSTAYQPLLEQAVSDIGMTEKFSHICGFRADFSKERCVEEICQDWGIDIDQAYFFTDTLRDVIELKNVMNHKRIIGCGWGWHGKERLLEELPTEQILGKPEDLGKFLTENK
jgi:phosphoglycolate phosphatase-like HAD superfamily hydrolase